MIELQCTDDVPRIFFRSEPLCRRGVNGFELRKLPQAELPDFIIALVVFVMDSVFRFVMSAVYPG